MRILFVSSTTTGGSGRSQRELATRLLARGHDVLIVADDKAPARWIRRIAELLADATERAPSVLARALGRLEQRPGWTGDDRTVEGVQHVISPVPQNAALRLLTDWGPNVVVGNSTERFTWRRVRAGCADLSIPAVLYVREITTLGHLDIEPDPGDAVLANAHSLSSAVEATGRTCPFIPSAIDTSVTRTESVRTTALLINPVETHGIDLLWPLAERCPQIDFVVQESWELSDADRTELMSRADAASNVTFRPRRPPSPALYADARVLLVPHLIDNRPRVVAEAHANSIPVVASDLPGLREVTGAGGIVLPANDTSGWAATLDELWTDDAAYAALCAQAAIEATAEERDPEMVADRVEVFLEAVVGGVAEAGA